MSPLTRSTFPKIRKPLAVRSTRSDGDFIVEAMAISHLFQRGRQDMDMAELIQDLARDLPEEGSDRAERAVKALLMDGYLRSDGTRVRLPFMDEDG